MYFVPQTSKPGNGTAVALNTLRDSGFLKHLVGAVM